MTAPLPSRAEERRDRARVVPPPPGFVPADRGRATPRGVVGRDVPPPPGFPLEGVEEGPVPFVAGSGARALPIPTRAAQKTIRDAHGLPVVRPPPGLPPRSAWEKPPRIAGTAPSTATRPGAAAGEFAPTSVRAEGTAAMPGPAPSPVLAPAPAAPKDALRPHRFLIESISSLLSESGDGSDGGGGTAPTASISVSSAEDDSARSGAPSPIAGFSELWGGAVKEGKAPAKDRASDPPCIFRYIFDSGGVVDDIASGGATMLVADFDVGAWGGAVGSYRRCAPRRGAMRGPSRSAFGPGATRVSRRARIWAAAALFGGGRHLDGYFLQ